MNKQNTESSKTMGPVKCPVCGDTNNMDFGKLDQDSDDRVYLDCKCNNCGATWKSWYKHTLNRTNIALVFDKNDDIEKGEQNGK